MLDYAAFGKRIRYIRKARNITQKNLAKGIDLSTSFVGHVERGTRKASMETLVDIANFFQVSLDELLAESLAIPSGASQKEEGISPKERETAAAIIALFGKLTRE